MTSTQILIPAGAKVIATSTTVINGDTFTTLSPAIVLYYNDDTDTYALASGFRSFEAPAADVTPA